MTVEPKMAAVPGFCSLALMPFIFSSIATKEQSEYGVTREYKSILTVPNGGPWGVWTKPEMCPQGYFAYGFSLKVQRRQGKLKDDTALNGIRLHCSQEDSARKIQDVESESGRLGSWTTPVWCPRGFLVAFSLRVESPQGPLGDDTAANNIKFKCSEGHEVEGLGQSWGLYSSWSDRCSVAICGLETRLESERKTDNTGLNDVRFYCCI
ncbi:vitelline membrane outer layer protein 1 homolog [Ambystoma mexicanum]|uniref:vitelline membrane outer layer protein 1 homolog n=1 Tax=Ambystoma mexicanum TaxID=8296 RepID=UPI0037E7BF90